MLAAATPRAFIQAFEDLCFETAQVESALEPLVESTLSYKEGQHYQKLFEQLDTKFRVLELQAEGSRSVPNEVISLWDPLSDSMRRIQTLLGRIIILPPTESEQATALIAAKVLEESQPTSDRISSLHRQMVSLHTNINKGNIDTASQLEYDEKSTLIDYYRAQADEFAKKRDATPSSRVLLTKTYNLLKEVQTWYDTKFAPETLKALIWALANNNEKEISAQIARLSTSHPQIEKKVYHHLYQIHLMDQCIKKDHPHYGRVVFYGNGSLCKDQSRLKADRIEAVKRVLSTLRDK